MDRPAPSELAQRERALLACLAELGGVAVAFSGGVDSSVLCHAAQRALGDLAVAVIADSPSLPRRELEEARAFARDHGLTLVELRTHELEDPSYVANRGDRCYFCKRALFDAMTRWAHDAGVSTLAFGEIADDLLDDRPGARAAAEACVRAPLRECGFTKEDVRAYARRHGLAVAEKPASACLASRLPVGRRVDRGSLERVEAAEESLRELGFRVLRVRHLGQRARVELGRDELEGGRVRREEIAAVLAGHGFTEHALEAYLPPAER